MQTVSVTCEAGEIQGRVKEEALLFAGIPYAQPPVGNLREVVKERVRTYLPTTGPSAKCP